MEEVSVTRPILVFGAGGRIGGELLALNADLIPATGQCDIRDPLDLAYDIGNARPKAIINLAACTLPDAEKPEKHDEAEDVNYSAVLRLATLCALCAAPLVHLSTDCVFDGAMRRKHAWHPNDPTAPLNHYGQTKRLGEQAIEAASAPHIILRTTGVYLRGKPNFLEGVLKNQPMTIVADTLYSPTDARELAKAILIATERVIEDPSVSGTYHFAGPDVMSYLDFAHLVQEEAKLDASLTPTTQAEREIIEGFKRPKNASLNSDKFAQVFGLRHRPTRECVRELVNPA